MATEKVGGKSCSDGVSGACSGGSSAGRNSGWASDTGGGKTSGLIAFSTDALNWLVDWPSDSVLAAG